MNAVITGASKGIGRAIALKLAKEGYNLALCARNLSDLQTLKLEVQKKHPKVQVYIEAVDCAQLPQVQDFAQHAHAQLGHVEVLINNVGQYTPGTILEEADDALIRQMETNVYPAHALSKFFGKEMRKLKSGYIINICSIASLNVVKEAASYSVTKVALLGLTTILREELKSSGVKVSAILPGATYTSSWEGTELAPDKFIQPEDVAQAVWTCLTLSPGATLDQLILKPISEAF
ncbi:MAG: SDR family NAD(P)-dependent oxidoreductase [Sphingobacteriaceae bacterium]